MFFRTKALSQNAAELGEPGGLHWDRPTSRWQSFWVLVTSWQFDVHPMLEGQRGGRVNLSFEGTTRLASCSGVTVSAEIKVTEDSDTPRSMSHHWQNVPSSIEGYGAVVVEGNAVPHLNLTLYCQPDFVDQVWRAFVTGFSTPGGNAVLDVKVGYPDEITPDFWTTTWQTKTMQVHEWKVKAGAAKQPPQ
jgi:hypothetical protein